MTAEAAGALLATVGQATSHASSGTASNPAADFNALARDYWAGQRAAAEGNGGGHWAQSSRQGRAATIDADAIYGARRAAGRQG